MAAEALPTTKRVEIINKREFAATAVNTDNETSVVHVMARAKPMTMPIYSSHQVQVALLTSEETGILIEYSDFSNFFFLDSAVELPEHIGINDCTINLLDNKQPLYSLIYSLGPVKLKILKTYIKANLASSFIKLSKSSTGTLILFVQKKDGSLCLCINY